MRVLRLAPLIATLLVLGLGAGFLVAQARELADDPEGPPPTVSWTTPRITGTVTETTTFTATATVSPTVSDLECVIRPKKFADGAVSCAVITGTGTVTVTLTVTPTDDVHGASLNFQVFLRSDGEERVLAPPLQVRLTNGLFTPDDEENEASEKGEDHSAGGQPGGSGTSHRPEFSPPGPPSWAGGGDDHPGSRGRSSDHGNAGGRRGR